MEDLRLRPKPGQVPRLVVYPSYGGQSTEFGQPLFIDDKGRATVRDTGHDAGLSARKKRPRHKRVYAFAPDAMEVVP